MRTFARYGLSSCVAAAMLAGCGGLQPPVGASGAMPQSSAIAGQAAHGASWMLPGAKRRDLLYVSDAAGPVYVYSYRSPRRQMGTLQGFNFPEGQCVDAAGDIWITDFRNHNIVKFAHGGSQPLKTLSTNEGGGWPVGCSVSPNGDLAVSLSLQAAPSGGGGILVFKNASGTPTSYTNVDCLDPSSPGYDNKGNLYVEGVKITSGYTSRAEVCELPAGGSALRHVSFNRKIRGLGSVMWDGKHIALGDWGIRYHSQETSEIFRASESRSGDLTSVGHTRLEYNGCENEVARFFLVGKKNPPVNNELATAVLSEEQSPYCGEVYAWRYTAGGTEVWSLSDKYPTGVSVSLASGAPSHSRIRK